MQLSQDFCNPNQTQAVFTFEAYVCKFFSAKGKILNYIEKKKFKSFKESYGRKTKEIVAWSKLKSASYNSL